MMQVCIISGLTYLGLNKIVIYMLSLNPDKLALSKSNYQRANFAGSPLTSYDNNVNKLLKITSYVFIYRESCMLFGQVFVDNLVENQHTRSALVLEFLLEMFSTILCQTSVAHNRL